MTTCQLCGVEIIYVREASGEQFPMNAREGSYSGDHRYIYSNPREGLVDRIPPHREAFGYTDHRETCSRRSRGR